MPQQDASAGSGGQMEDGRTEDGQTEDGRILGVHHTRPGFVLPSGACDCHTHVFGPPDAYPWAADRDYTPGPAGVEDLLALQHRLRLDRVVIVHPSPYGTDNRRTLDALRRLGPARARGVAVIDPAMTDADLRDMHEAGVRGARIVLEAKGRHDPAVAGPMLRTVTERIAPLGWHLQTYTRLPVIEALRDQLSALPVPLVFDHFARADVATGPAQPGFAALLSLVGVGKAWVKLSAPHRISKRPDLATDLADVAPVARVLIAANPERMLWGSDWPHTGGGRGPRNPAVTEPFNPIDDGQVLDRLAEWAGDDATLHRILVGNPGHLYRF